jgi:hypothetical protein
VCHCVPRFVWSAFLRFLMTLLLGTETVLDAVNDVLTREDTTRLLTCACLACSIPV